MTRNGKIARLPRHLRGQLNTRLQDGEPGRKLVDWLNGLEPVQAILTEEFGGRPISEQNLSEWKQGGYRDWERHQSRLELVGRLAEQAEDYDEAAEGVPVSHVLANALAAELADTFLTLIQQTDDPKERLNLIRKLLPDLAELRKEDRKAVSAMIERELWEQEERQRDLRASKEHLEDLKRQATAPIWARQQLPTYAEGLGGGDFGWKAAAFLMEIEYGLPSGSLPKRPGNSDETTGADDTHQTESNQIKPV